MTSSVPLPARRREWIGLAVLALPTLLVSMDLTVLHLAVPQLSKDLQPSSVQLLWIVDIYSFMVAGSLITMGALGDRIGRRRLLLIGAGAFGISSLLAAFSINAEMLIVARALLGVAGATLAPSTLSLIRNMFCDQGQRRFAIAVWMTSFMLGAAIGPLLGGALLEYFWWGSVFLMAVPVMVLLLVIGPVLLPEYRDRQAGRLDLLGAVLSLAAVLALVYGLKQIATESLGWLPALSVVAGLILGFVFARRQHKLSDPLLDLSLFGNRGFSVSMGILTLSVFVYTGTYFFLVQYLRLVLGLSPLEAGLWTLPAMGGGIVGAMSAPAIARRIHPAIVIGAGLAFAVVGFGLLTQVGVHDGGLSRLALLVTGSVVFSVGLGPPNALSTDMVVGAAPPARAGSASALSQTGNELGGALGLAVLGSIGYAVYRSQITSAVPANIPTEGAQAVRGTLGGAAAVAEQLPDPSGATLLDAAREAFTHGLQMIALVSAAIVAVMAILTAVLLRRVRPSSAPEEQPDSQQDQTVVGQ